MCVCVCVCVRYVFVEMLVKKRIVKSYRFIELDLLLEVQPHHTVVVIDTVAVEMVHLS